MLISRSRRSTFPEDEFLFNLIHQLADKRLDDDFHGFRIFVPVVQAFNLLHNGQHDFIASRQCLLHATFRYRFNVPITSVTACA